MSSEEKIILNRYKEMQYAMINKDINILDEIVKDGTVFTHMSGKVQTKEEYFEDIRIGKLNYKSYKLEKPKIKIERNKAILNAIVTLTANAYGAEDSWPFNVNAYFEKINGNWIYTNIF